MVKTIVKDILFLGQKSVPATPLDMNVVNDLRDTLAANRERCVGMAANMIGYKKNMIIVSVGPVDMIMINPVICSKSGRYETEEGCLSLEGKRKTTRYKKIEVLFQDAGFVKRKMAFEGNLLHYLLTLFSSYHLINYKYINYFILANKSTFNVSLPSCANSTS